ncbi:phytoene synthase [Pseudoscourfieldia marina]
MDLRRQAAAFCVNHVRANDYEGFLTVLALPARHRASAFAVRALNARLVDAVDRAHDGGDAGAARLRLAWWREAMARIYDGRTPDDPVCRAISVALAAAGGNGIEHMSALVATRERDVEQVTASPLVPPASVQALVDYADGTHGMLMRATAELTSGTAVSGEANRAITQAGIGAGIATVLRGTARHLGQGLLYVPSDVLQQAGMEARDAKRLLGLGPGAVGARSDEPKDKLDEQRRHLIATAVRPLAEQAKNALRLADARLAALPRTTIGKEALSPDAAARAACLPRVSAGIYLRKLEACGYDPVHPNLLDPKRGVGVPRLELQMRLAYRHLVDGVR